MKQFKNSQDSPWDLFTKVKFHFDPLNIFDNMRVHYFVGSIRHLDQLMDLVNISLRTRVVRNQTSIFSSRQGGDIALFGKLFFNWLILNILATSIIT